MVETHIEQQGSQAKKCKTLKRSSLLLAITCCVSAFLLCALDFSMQHGIESHTTLMLIMMSLCPVLGELLQDLSSK